MADVINFSDHVVPVMRETGRGRAGVRYGYGLLFQAGLSLGVVDYVIRSLQVEIHIYAPHVQGTVRCGQSLTLVLNTGEEMDGVCLSVDSSSWLVFQRCPI